MKKTKSLLIMAFLSLGVTGCVQQMADHAGYRPLRPTTYFGDGRSARPLIAGTVARGQLANDTALHEGYENGEPVQEFPFEMTAQVLDRGKQRYEVFCAMCHGKTGHGDGRIVQRGFTPPPDYIRDDSRYYQLRDRQIKLTRVPVGHIYDVITRGYGAMGSYREQIPVRDRWAIVGYVRALQYSQSSELREALGKAQTKDKKESGK